MFSYTYIEKMIILDKFRFCFAVTIIIVSIIIYYYNSVYLDRYYYHLLIYLFVIVILILIISINLVFIIIWWDILGLVSFLLIIYYNNYIIIKNSILVIMFNRFGDVFLIISSIYFLISNTINLTRILSNTNSIILFIAIAVKSSQFPLNTWLTKAIVAPLPVSSLVHSSTLVTVGVYFTFRFISYLNISLVLNILIFRIVYYRIVMLHTTDLKKLIALSTINNLSIIIYFIILYMYLFTYFYIIIHALFKSIIFLCIGVLINNLNDNQDSRTINNVVNKDLFIVYLIILSLIICSGFIYFSIFICKDMFFDLLYINNFINFIFFFFFFMFTLIYSLKVYITITENSWQSVSFSFNNFKFKTVIIFIFVYNIFLVKLIILNFIYSLVVFFMNLLLKVLFIVNYFLTILIMLDFYLLIKNKTCINLASLEFFISRLIFWSIKTYFLHLRINVINKFWFEITNWRLILMFTGSINWIYNQLTVNFIKFYFILVFVLLIKFYLIS